jgi:AbrB family looped-hinge helix DNA binding protein
MSYTTTVSSKGQVVIPEEIRKLLSIKAGVKFNLTVIDGKIVMEMDDYELRLEQARIKNRQHIIDKKIGPVSDDDIKKAREGTWST